MVSIVQAEALLMATTLTVMTMTVMVMALVGRSLEVLATAPESPEYSEWGDDHMEQMGTNGLQLTKDIKAGRSSIV